MWLFRTFKEKMKIPKEGIDIGELGRVKFKKGTYIIGLSHLRKLGIRGIFIPHRAKEPGAILVSTHLPIKSQTLSDESMVLEAIIHETLHLAFPESSEKQIVAGANLLAKVLRTYQRSIRVDSKRKNT